jgi:hypothetical protein
MTFRETLLAFAERADETFALARAQVLAADVLCVKGREYA